MLEIRQGPAYVALEAHLISQTVAETTEDAKEGPRAWLEKREPIFKGK